MLLHPTDAWDGILYSTDAMEWILPAQGFLADCILFVIL